jgi:(hydroxyamino)benzene mutase
MQNTNRSLLWHGMCLFLIGLLTGFAETHFANMRMGLAAHLEGVMNGTFLVALGAAWHEVQLSPSTKAVAYGTALYGTYGNWLVTTLAATFGTAALSPITGTGHNGHPWQESLVTIGFLTVGIAMVASFSARSVGSSRQSAGVNSAVGSPIHRKGENAHVCRSQQGSCAQVLRRDRQRQFGCDG